MFKNLGIIACALIAAHCVVNSFTMTKNAAETCKKTYVIQIPFSNLIFNHRLHNTGQKTRVITVPILVNYEKVQNEITWLASEEC